MKLPKKITPCPIVESILEIRFESELPGEAIFGIIYNSLKGDFPKFDKLPILDIPESIRSSDPNLSLAPHYKLSAGDFIFQVGPKVFSLSNVNEYIGWKAFYEEINLVFKKIYELTVIKETKRVGLRYINLFPKINIFEKSDLKINLKQYPLENDVNLLVNLPANEFTNTLRMVSNTQFYVSEKILDGSVIDIDTSLNNTIPDIYTNMEKIINAAHLEEKKLFFSLLKDEYIKTLDPEY